MHRAIVRFCTPAASLGNGSRTPIPKGLHSLAGLKARKWVAIDVPSPYRARGEDSPADFPRHASGPDPEMGAMMRVHRLVGALLASALLQACWDDPESPPNHPPDLRLEDVVGCWHEGDGDGGYCLLNCFDPSGEQLYRTQSPFSGQYENVGHFLLHGWEIEKHVLSKSNTSVADSAIIRQSYRRVGPDLYTLTHDLQLGTRYTPVNLDSTLPCGTPFQLLPKPAGWTLF